MDRMRRAGRRAHCIVRQSSSAFIPVTEVCPRPRHTVTTDFQSQQFVLEPLHSLQESDDGTKLMDFSGLRFDSSSTATRLAPMLHKAHT